MDYYKFAAKSALLTILGTYLITETDGEDKAFDTYQCVNQRYMARAYGYITVIFGLYHLIPILEQLIAISTIIVYLQLWLNQFKYENCGRLQELVNVYTISPLFFIAAYVLLQHHKGKFLFAYKRSSQSK